jgi:hypothetical protein
MAESIQTSVALTVGTSALIRGSVSSTVTQTGNENFGGTQSIATSSTAVQLGAVSTIGALMVINTDATNYVEVDSGTAFDKFPQKILPGKSILLAPQTTTIYAKANTAAVIIRVVAVEL